MRRSPRQRAHPWRLVLFATLLLSPLLALVVMAQDEPAEESDVQARDAEQVRSATDDEGLAEVEGKLASLSEQARPQEGSRGWADVLSEGLP